ncbi:hypothetical protein G5V57_04575 [Nordella sp. HKS 07]|nr:hypothetical protein G5V57_04575 [Nordella sp. HKS 07]
MTDGKTVTCEGRELDDYGPLIARCSTDDVSDIGAKLVSRGLAWAFVKYSADYIDLEMKPQRDKLGVWQSRTQPPWAGAGRRLKRSPLPKVAVRSKATSAPRARKSTTPHGRRVMPRRG